MRAAPNATKAGTDAAQQATAVLHRVHPATALRVVKLIHTVVWAFFAACILTIPVAAYRGHLIVALPLAAIVWVEVLVLAANRWRCPLTAVAARFTDDRRENFDIYLPLWLARHNKLIFGSLFVIGLFTLLTRALT